jgi:phospholipase/lecithinase/hemolysin
MSRYLRLSLRLLVLCWIVLGVSLPASAGELRRVITFGDSLSDPGNAFVLLGTVSRPPFELIPDAPYLRGGFHFTNGETWIEQWTRALELPRSGGPALLAPRVFSNYAVGGARARPAGQMDLTTQVNLFLGNHRGGVGPDTLTVLFLGGNDVRDALEALATDPSGAQSGVILQQAVTAIIDNLRVLASRGARAFFIANAPNLALVPAVRLQGPTAQGAAQYLAMVFNEALAQALAEVQQVAPVQITSFDIFGILNAVAQAPSLYGFEDVEHSCITPGVIVHAVCRHPDEYLFWDGIHPTRAAHALLARAAAQQLDAVRVGVASE